MWGQKFWVIRLFRVWWRHRPRQRRRLEARIRRLEIELGLIERDRISFGPGAIWEVDTRTHKRLIEKMHLYGTDPRLLLAVAKAEGDRSLESWLGGAEDGGDHVRSHPQRQAGAARPEVQARRRGGRELDEP